MLVKTSFIVVNYFFQFGIYANPILNFDWPKILIDRVAERSRLENFTESRLPQFTMSEKLKIRGTYDFLGLNHYITVYSKTGKEPQVTTPSVKTDAGGEISRDPKWEGCAADWIKVGRYR